VRIATRSPSKFWLTFVFAILAGTVQVFAQAYPSRPITLIIPFGAGGTNDIAARLLANELGTRLGQSVVVENRPGASGNIAAQAAAKAAPDGYTLFWAQPATHGINANVFRSLPYDPERDFAPVSLVGRATLMLVANTSLPAGNIPELIELARKRPGQINFGSAGPGTTPHMAGELLRSLAGIDLQHVPYRTSTTALQDLIGGRIELHIDGIQFLLPYVQAGTIRALGVTADQRSAVLSAVPSINETLSGFDVVSWNGIVAPARTPELVILRLNSEINDILRDPGVRAQYEKLGIAVSGSSPADMSKHVRSELERWRQVVAKTGTRIEE
jgi:tripartite-type tricarboxylate transporter receptor subunit TctC